MADEQQQGERREQQQRRPIIIKKTKKRHQGEAVHAWKVAYADFVTALMALFIALWVLNAKEEVREQVAAYFKDPVAFFEGSGVSVIEGEAQKTINEELLRDIIRQYMAEKGELSGVEEALEESFEQMPDLASILENVVIEYVDEGMRIELIETQDKYFFEVGTARLKPEAYRVVRAIGERLGELPNRIIIEGHTDARPYGTQRYTNYELSADRANAARRALLEGGVSEAQLYQVRAYADNELRDPDDPFASSNRRVSIIVPYLD
jgi:chemotaxis protein MotB